MIPELLHDIAHDFPSSIQIPPSRRYDLLPGPEPVPRMYFLLREDSSDNICQVIKSVDIDDWYAATSKEIVYVSQFIMRAVLENSEAMLDAGLVSCFVNGLTLDEVWIDLRAFHDSQLKLILRFLAELVKLDPNEDCFDHEPLQRVSMETLKSKAREKPMPLAEVMRRLGLKRLKQD
jgi:hypothetical protein